MHGKLTESNLAELIGMFTEAPIGFCCFDMNLRFLFINKWLAKINGISVEEHLGRSIHEIIPEVAAGVEAQLRHVIETGEPVEGGMIDAETPAYPGLTRSFQHYYYAIKSEAGKDSLVACVVQEITARKQAEKRADEMQRELHHAGRRLAMGEVASMIAHELNQPLTAIANFGEASKRLLEEGGDSLGRAVEFIEKSVAQAHRASDIIRHLSDFVTPGEGEMEPIAVNDIVQEAAQIALVGSADQGIQTNYDFAEDLPEISGDRIQLQQVVVNLIRNGIDAMLDPKADRDDNLRLTIQTSRDEDSAVRISVADTGRGVADNSTADIFAPFITSKKDGLGIGLSVSKSIVEAHGGKIWFEPNPDRGCTFLFTLRANKHT